MKIFLPIFFLLFLGVFGCDNGGGNDSFVISDQAGSVSTTPNTTPPTSGGGATGTQAAISFNPSSSSSVLLGSADAVIQVTGTPPGGVLALSSINDGGTGGSFNLGPQTDEFTFASSITTATGTATCAVTYIPPAPFTPVTAIFTINVGVFATLTFTPPSPQTVIVGTDLVVTATGTPPGGSIFINVLSTGGTGATFVAGPGANDFTFTGTTITASGTATCDVTYTPPAPNFPITATYTVDALDFTAFSQENLTDVTVPPFSTATGTMDVVTDSPILFEVRVQVNISYGFFSDLSVSVASPATTSLSLCSFATTGSSVITAVFEDTAAAPMGAPSSGSFLASGGSLDSTFNGELTAGTWTLTLVNGTSYTATLLGWALAFNGDTSIF